MRHHRQNGGTPVTSEDEEEHPRSRSRKPLQENRQPFSENQNALNSARSGKPSKNPMDNSSILSQKTSLRELSYPTNDRFQPSAASADALKSAAQSGLKGPAGEVQALACAMTDELKELNRAWSLGHPDQVESAEVKIASALTKLAKKAMKVCEAKASELAKVADAAAISVGAEGSAVEVQRRCEEAQARIAATEERVRELREAARRPVQMPPDGPRQIMKDLATRIRDADIGAEAAASASLQCAELSTGIDDNIQGLVAVVASLQHQHQLKQDELEAAREHNQSLCPPSSEQQALGLDNGARIILRSFV